MGRIGLYVCHLGAKAMTIEITIQVPDQLGIDTVLTEQYAVPDMPVSE